MRCPHCGSGDSKVTDSREADGSIRRRRRCVRCAERFWTYERVETERPLVVKRDGTREEWDRNKIVRGVRVACSKRPVSHARIEELVDEVEARLASGGRQEVPSAEVGQAVMRALRSLDEVAYIRFASVYLRFPDARGFLDAVEAVQRPPRPSDEQIPLNL